MTTNKPTRGGDAAASPTPPTWRGPARLRLVPPDSPRRRRVTPLGIAPPGTVPLAEPVLVGLGVEDARHHVHVPGPTGTGKTTLLLNVACSQARAGRGLAVFDPKGDLVRDLLDRLPESVAPRLVLIDPDEAQAPPALNLFHLGADPESVADQLVGVMAKVWAQYWGPRTDDLARHAVLTLAHLPGTTLADVPVLLADKAYRRRVLGEVRRRAGPVESAGLLAFWSWYDDLSPGQASVQVGPLLSKLRAVLSRRFAASLFGVGASTFRLADVLDGGVLLVRLPPTLGEDTVRLAGSLLLAALLNAAAGRAQVPEHQRPDAALLLDEAHTFLHLPVGVDAALATARSLHLSLWLAHQHLGQLSASMFAAIDANARNKVFFTLSPEDARKLAHHMAPYFAPEDLMRRDAYGVVVRLVYDGQDGEPFSLATRPAPPVIPGRAEVLRAAARARGLSTVDRATLAEARRVGPAARTMPAEADQQASHDWPVVNPTGATTGPTGPTGTAEGGPTTPPTNPTDPTRPTGGVQAPRAAGLRPPHGRRRKP